LFGLTLTTVYAIAYREPASIPFCIGAALLFYTPILLFVWRSRPALFAIFLSGILGIGTLFIVGADLRGVWSANLIYLLGIVAALAMKARIFNQR